MRLLILLAATLFQLPATKLEIHRGYPTVQVFINGQGPYRMLIDTGNTSSSVLPSVARETGLTLLHSVVVSSLAGDRTVPIANTHIRVGSSAAVVELMISPLPGIAHLGANLHGILGQNFLARTPYLIDYSARRLYFDDEATRRAQSLPATFPARTVAGRLAINVQIESPYRLVLDSGASHLFLYCRTRCPHLNGVQAGPAITNSGSVPVRRGTLPRATLGSLHFRNPSAVIVESASADGEEADGLIPTHWFSAIYIDPIRQEVRLNPRSLN